MFLCGFFSKEEIIPEPEQHSKIVVFQEEGESKNGLWFIYSKQYLVSVDRGSNMALTDDPNPRKRAKLEEQMAIVQAEVDRLKVELSKNASEGA